jgi:hypothetical protein
LYIAINKPTQSGWADGSKERPSLFASDSEETKQEIAKAVRGARIEDRAKDNVD